MSGSPPELVGRDRELTDLVNKIRATAAGMENNVSVVTGKPGVGKSLLVWKAGGLARRSGLTVAAGCASEQHRSTPMETVDVMLRGCRRLDRVIRRLGVYGEDPTRYLARVVEMLANHAARTPMLISVDDVQWADEASANALRVLVAELRSSPVMWIFARRPAGVGVPSPGEDLVNWLLANGAPELSLGPLDQDSARQLCSNVLGARPDGRLLDLVTRGGGHPLLIEQLLKALRSARRIEVTHAVASVTGDDLPVGFVAAVELRLRALSEPANGLLRAGSIFGRVFTIADVAALVESTMTVVVAAAEEVVTAGLLEEHESRLEFCHDLVREVVYERMSKTVRAHLHREAATLLLRSGRPAVAADHVMRAGSGGDREAVDILRQAAADLTDLAPRTAAGYLLRALEILDRRDPQWPKVCAEAVGLLVSAGHIDAARTYGEQALAAGPEPEVRACLIVGLVNGFKHMGHNREVLEYVNRALDLPSVPIGTRARLYGIKAHALLYVRDGSGADAAGEEADRLGRLSGEVPASVMGLAARSTAARSEGRLDDSLAFARAAVDVAASHGGSAVHRHPRLWLGSALAAMDQFADAAAAYTLAQEDAQRLGTAWSQPLAHFHVASLRMARAELDDAIAEAEAGLEFADSYQVRQLCVPLWGLLAVIAITRNQVTTARAHIRAMTALLNTGITAAPEMVDWPIALLHQAHGDMRRAFDALAGIYDRFPGRLLLFSHDPGCAPSMVHIARAVGDHARAEAAATAARLIADRNPGVVSLAGAALHADALLRDDLDTLRAAVSHLRASPRPLLLAAALEDLAVIEYGRHRRSDAVDHLGEALNLYQSYGARRAAIRVRKRRLSIGTTHASDDAFPPVASPLDGLTPTELDVARLIASGATNIAIANRLGTSRHTVDNHCRKIYAKLHVKSRIEVTRIVLTEFDIS